MNRNRTLSHIACLLALFAGLARSEAQSPAIIPLPQKMEVGHGSFEIGAGTMIVAGKGAAETCQYLASELNRRAGALLKVAGNKDAVAKGNIELTLDDANPSLVDEGYVLSVTPDSVTIRAHAAAGLFYGAQSLLQLLPLPEAGSKTSAPALPCVFVEDHPRFHWRGLMLDVSRHFFNKEEVKRLLDEMAWHKMNVFHWHLVDDQGWRIEIKKYPRLTELGAWRKAVGFGLDPKSGTAFGPDGRYGGFYTQEDIREVVAYAAARHITIVPEIEMPGHSSAALMAYPQFSCTGGPFSVDLPGGVFNGVYCAGNEATFGFVEDVLIEVFALFPGKFIHVGGDEVLTDNWKACPKCQERMKHEGFTKEMELESYFIRRVEKIVNAHGKRLVGWSEIREGGLAPSATVMDWVGGALEAASAGHDVVMSPLKDCYFDHYQSLNQAKEPKAIGGYLPLKQVYAFDPIPTHLPVQFESHILGGQANVWTEYIPNFKQVEYMVFPRLSAMAEVDWSPKTSRNWDDFLLRVAIDCKRLDQLGVNHRALTDEPLAPAPEQ